MTAALRVTASTRPGWRDGSARYGEAGPSCSRRRRGATCCSPPAPRRSKSGGAMVYRKVKDLEARIHMLERQRGDAARACDFAAAQLRVARKLFLRMGTGALD